MLLSGSPATVSALPSATHTPLLSQDLNALVASNGKILKTQPIEVSPKWDKQTESFEITYLSDGLKITGFIVKPKGDGSSLPALVFNRGGSREYGKVTVGMLKHLSSLAAQGYVVLASQYRGNDGGEGREEFGGNDVNDVLHIIKLAKSLPFVDPAKIVMLGYSRGGMMTYLAINHGADIQAAVVVGGITDVGQLYVERDEEMKKTIRDLVGMNDAEWKKRSAYYWPEKIDTPVLILHGGDDRRVDVSQAKKFAQKLEAASREYELVIFPKGDHGLKTHRAERNRKIFEWFDKYLNR
jgi:dipeptidyl aminopeptidase/acylaminoacyl peptidase